MDSNINGIGFDNDFHNWACNPKTNTCNLDNGQPKCSINQRFYEYYLLNESYSGSCRSYCCYLYYCSPSYRWS